MALSKLIFRVFLPVFIFLIALSEKHIFTSFEFFVLPSVYIAGLNQWLSV